MTYRSFKATKFDESPLIKHGGKEDDLLRCSEPPEPLKPLLRQISDLEPTLANESMGKSYLHTVSTIIVILAMCIGLFQLLWPWFARSS